MGKQVLTPERAMSEIMCGMRRFDDEAMFAITGLRVIHISGYPECVLPTSKKVTPIKKYRGRMRM